MFFSFGVTFTSSQQVKTISTINKSNKKISLFEYILGFTNINKCDWSKCPNLTQKFIKECDLSFTKITLAGLQKILKTCIKTEQRTIDCSQQTAPNPQPNIPSMSACPFSFFESKARANSDKKGVYCALPGATIKDLKNLFEKEGSKIKKLDLSKATGIDPFDYGTLDWSKCPLLKELDHSNVIITAIELEEIFKECPNLKGLRLSNSTIVIKDQLNMIFTKGCKLEKLDLSNNRISSTRFEKLDWNLLKNLKYLGLNNVNISDAALEKIVSNCSTLEKLELEETSVRFKKINMKALKNIKYLSLGYNIEAADLEHVFAECQNLIKLDLKGCHRVTAGDFEKLDWKSLKNLEYLDVGHTEITAMGLENICTNCPALKTLKLSGCKNLAVFATTVFNLRNLRHLLMRGNKLSWKSLKNLEHLDFSNTCVAKDDVQQIIADCPNLEDINLSGCTNLTEIYQKHFNKKTIFRLKNPTDGFKVMLSEIGNILTTIDFSGLLEINFEDKNLDWNKCPQLKVLNLLNTKITALGLKKTLSGCKSLEVLGLYRCKNITAAEFEKFEWPHLKGFNFGGTHITEECLKKILATNNQLEWVSLEECTNLRRSMRKAYLSADAIAQLKKDLEVPRWTTREKVVVLGIAVAAAAVGAMMIYKRSQRLQNISKMMWQRVLPFVKKLQRSKWGETKNIAICK